VFIRRCVFMELEEEKKNDESGSRNGSNGIAFSRSGLPAFIYFAIRDARLHLFRYVLLANAAVKQIAANRKTIRLSLDDSQNSK
jgi:hypothetical protein